jgi:hypothetical protein
MVKSTELYSPHKRITMNSVPGAAAGDLSYAVSYLGFNVEDNGSNGWTLLGDGGTGNGGTAIMGDIFGNTTFYNLPNSGGSNRTLQSADLGNNVSLRLGSGSVHAPGVVMIGQTGVPSGYKLAVDGKIISEEINVQLKGTWPPDYVFEKDYNLLPLSEVETYINQNKHLPEVPSAKEMEANGLNLKEMNLILLKKVEELTLHLIEMKKENANQQKEINSMKKEIRQR